MAEVGHGSRADAFDIAAIGRERQIGRKHLVLAQPPLDLDSAHDLAELGAERAVGPRL